MEVQTVMQNETRIIDDVIWINPERQGGEPCFINTRVPVKILFDYLEGGEPLEEFLEGFPPVTREQAEKVLELAKASLFDLILHSESSPRP
jgi:uncharacterized protein (DUF433 family)